MAKSDPAPTKKQVVFSWDTTGSMYPCLGRVKEEVEEVVNKLFKDIPDLEVGCIAHGDYCDGKDVIKTLDLTDDKKKVINFIRNCGRTGGGDAPECYELVLHEVRSFSWTAGSMKAFTMIGDDVPHGPKESQNAKKLDWRNELNLLQEAGIKVYAVQCLDRSHATSFWRECAKETGGFHLTLAQFDNVRELLMAVAYKQEGDEQLQNYEKEVAKSGRMNRSLDAIFGIMLGRTKPRADFGGKADLEAVPSCRFQIMRVKKDEPIKSFVERNGLEFSTGKGFYEFTKPVLVQAYKEVVLQNKSTGDLFTGHKARELLGLGDGVSEKIKPASLEKYKAFIQSTSNNRKLLGGTSFLYEVNMDR